MKKHKIFKLLLVILFVFMTSGVNFSALAVSYDNKGVTATSVEYTLCVNDQQYAMYAFSINNKEYVCLRSIAEILSMTSKRFQVEWNEADYSIQIITGRPYSQNGTDFSLSDKAQLALPSTAAIYCDGNLTDLKGYNIEGYTFLNLNDIADLMGFKVNIDAESRKAAVLNADYDENNGYSLTLIAGSNDALYNGETVALSAQPFVQNDTFYIPLKAVTELLGGLYSFEDNTATIELSGVTTKYQIGSHSVVVDGETYEVSGDRDSFSASEAAVTIDDEFAPMIYDETVYVPDNYCYEIFQYPNSSLDYATEYPESNMIIMGGYINEYGTNDVKLNYDYDLLSDDFKAQLENRGIVDEIDGLDYNVEEYANSGIEVYVMRLKDELHEDVEGMDGRVCAIRITGYQYNTVRGLTPYDTVYRAWLSYGRGIEGIGFSYKAEGGYVGSITFSTHYYGGQF